jgi:hypothetical protein
MNLLITANTTSKDGSLGNERHSSVISMVTAGTSFKNSIIALIDKLASKVSLIL